jgi:RNA polymerase sigma factor (sigma-70 family)
VRTSPPTSKCTVSGNASSGASVHELASFIECDPETVLDGLRAAAAYEALLPDAPPFIGRSDRIRSVATACAEASGDPVAQLEAFVDPSRIFASGQDLSRRERLVLYLRFQEARSQADIAKRLGMSQSQVASMIRTAVPRLRARGDFAAA